MIIIISNKEYLVALANWPISLFFFSNSEDARGRRIHRNLASLPRLSRSMLFGSAARNNEAQGLGKTRTRKEVAVVVSTARSSKFVIHLLCKNLRRYYNINLVKIYRIQYSRM